VILAAIQDRARQGSLSCLNLHFAGPGCDERDYARMAAARANVDLVEQERPRDVNLQSLLSLPPSARPSTNHTDHIMFGASTTRFAQQIGAKAVLFGQMGDELFCRNTGTCAVLDYVWMHGLRPHILEVAADVASLSGDSVWSEARHGVAAGVLTRPWAPGRWKNRLIVTADPQPFLTPRALNELNPRYRDEWLRSVDTLPLGKLYQIADISSA
jgi:hypothetical protein